MFKHIALSLSIFLSLACANQAHAEKIEVAFSLTPAGDFKAKTDDLKGDILVKDGKYSAQNLIVDLKSLKTGISLRDKHIQDKLETSKFSEAKLISASGENGKGSGKILIRGIEKEISGTYEIKDKNMVAKFELKLSDYGITGIKYLGVGVKDTIIVTVNAPIKN